MRLLTTLILLIAGAIQMTANDGSVTGRLYRDINNNGTYDAGTDQGQGAVRIDLYEDVNGNGVYDSGTDDLEETVHTAWDGTYTFDEVDPDDYVIVPRVDDMPHTDIFGANTVDYTLSTTLPGFTLSNNQDLTGQDIGYDGASVTCYAVADDSDKDIVMVNRFSGYNFAIGDRPTGESEGVALSSDATQLVATDKDDEELYQADLSSGGGSSVSGQSYGQGDGECGTIDLGENEFESMTLDATTGVIYAIGEQNDCSGSADILFAIDVSTGLATNSYTDANGATQYLFADVDNDGSNDWYVKLNGDEDDNWDDIAVDPTDGQMWGVRSHDELYLIDKVTGETTEQGEVDNGNDKIKGLTFASDGYLYCTTDNNDRNMWAIDIDGASGSAPNKEFDQIEVAEFSDDNKDFQACACISGSGGSSGGGSSGTETIAGRLYRDNDTDGVWDSGADQGQGGVQVDLYVDENDNNAYDSGTDTLSDTEYTAYDGTFTFSSVADGEYILVPRDTDMPHTDIFGANTVSYTLTASLPAVTISGASATDQDIAYSGASITCYAVADDSDKQIVMTNRFSGYNVALGERPTDHSEGVALSMDATKLVATDKDDDKLYQADLVNGGGSLVGAAVYGTGDGECGEIDLGDKEFEAMALDATSGMVFAIDEDSDCGNDDILFAIDPETGLAVNSYTNSSNVTVYLFDDVDGDGTNDFYVKLNGDEDDKFEDIAIDPDDGQMWGVRSNDELYLINKYTGETTEQGEIDTSDKVKGLTFASDGVMYGTTDNNDRNMYAIDIDGATGSAPNKDYDMTLVATFADDSKDFQACACISGDGPIVVNPNAPVVWGGANTTEWNNAANWSGGVVPAEGAVVQIGVSGSGNYPALDQTRSVSDFTIDSGASVDLNENKLKVSGDFTINGTFNQTTGIIEMNGTDLQTIGGSSEITFNNLIIDNADTVRLATDCKFWGYVSPKDGVLDFDEQTVTLMSDDTKAASIGRIYSGAEVIGDIVWERYFPAGPGSWRMFGSPITNATFEQWNDDFVTTGFTGADYPTYPSAANPWSNVRYYDETFSAGEAYHMDSGFVSVSNVTDLIDANKGYFIYIVPGPTTVDVSGEWNRGAINQGLDYTNTNTDSFNDGWNLLSNPYPSAIDWDAALGWTKTDLDNAVYMYDPINGRYTGYVNGVEINGASGKIASGQAFWVKSGTGSPSIAFDEEIKTTLTGTFFRSFDVNTHTTIRINMESGNVSDEFVVALNEQATHNYDNQYDMFKLYSPSSSMPGLGVKSPLADSDEDLSVLSIPTPEENLILDVNFKGGDYEEFVMTNTLVDSYDNNMCLVLEDKFTGEMIPFDQGDSYSFLASDTIMDYRFALHMSAPLQLENIDEHCPNGDDAWVSAMGTGEGPYSYQWFDADGTLLKETLETFGGDTLNDISAGFYEVQVTNSQQMCNSSTGVAEVLAATGLELVSQASIDHCNSESDGEITIDLEEEYMWNVEVKRDGSTIYHEPMMTADTALTNLPFGVYKLIYDNNCVTESSMLTINLNDPDFVEAQAVCLNDTVNLYSGDVAMFTSNAGDADSFIWDFGDGQTDSSQMNPMHSYSAPATPAVFEASLTVFKGDCEDTQTVTVTVVNDAGVQDYSLAQNIDSKEVTTQKDEPFTNSNDQQTLLLTPKMEVIEAVQIRVMNSAGQLVIQDDIFDLEYAIAEIDISSLTQGIYFVQVIQEEQVIYASQFLK